MAKTWRLPVLRCSDELAEGLAPDHHRRIRGHVDAGRYRCDEAVEGLDLGDLYRLALDREKAVFSIDERLRKIQPVVGPGRQLAGVCDAVTRDDDLALPPMQEVAAL